MRSNIIHSIVLLIFTSAGVLTWVPAAKGAPSDTSKSNLAGCIDELDAFFPGMKEKVKTFTEEEFYRLSERMNDLTGIKDLNEADLAERVAFDLEEPTGGNAQYRLGACLAKMQYAKTHNGNTVPPNTKSTPADIPAPEITSADNDDTASTATPTTEKEFDSCQPALDAQEREFADINARNPNTQTIVMGTSVPAVVPGMQALLYMTEQRMSLLDRYCKGQPQYSQYPSIRKSHDETMKACLRSTSDNSVCKPNVPW